MSGYSYFPGFGQANSQYVHGNPTNNSDWLSSDTTGTAGAARSENVYWQLDIPAGKPEGSYRTDVTYRVETTTDPNVLP